MLASSHASTIHLSSSFIMNNHPTVFILVQTWQLSRPSTFWLFLRPWKSESEEVVQQPHGHVRAGLIDPFPL
jgi:hypothetical protein